MPVYTFRCTACGAERDVTSSIEERDYPRTCRNLECAKKRAGLDYDHVEPYRCAARMVRMPTAANFEVKGYSARNGYSK